ncbi:MAG: hypothetical protein IPM82_19520 [Saprospiraceae bacterium]|nr:hypothetical protein [Saprospiraceae bacterium]
MKKYLLPLLLLPAFFSCKNEPSTSTTTPADTASAAVVDESITLPNGFKAYIFAENLGAGGRHIAVNSNGDVYVQMHDLANGKGIAALRDTNGDGKADSTEYFGSNVGTGMEIQGNHLYCSSDDEVFRYDLKAGELVPDENSRVLLIGGFPKQNEHASKSLALDGKGGIYVNIGAPSNCCQVENRTPGSPGQDPAHCSKTTLASGVLR